MSQKLSLNERLDDFWIYPKLSKITDSRKYQDQFFDFLNRENETRSGVSLYIHIPFCESSCMFCPYYKEPISQNKKGAIDYYVKAIIKEMEMYAETPYFKSATIAAIHFGGGNPLMIGFENIKYIIDSAKRLFEIKEDADLLGIEGSLCSVNEKYIQKLKSIGFNRMSFGIQTFVPQIRELMNIKTTLPEIFKGIDILKKAGMNYCIDMMYNLPNQTEKDVIQDLEVADSLDAMHIDVYNMAVFPNTYLEDFCRTSSDVTIRPSNKNQIRHFQIAHAWLVNHGYTPIISHTYSKKQKSAHLGDQLYLMSSNVLGIGLSSRSYIDGNAFRNCCNREDYYTNIYNNIRPVDLATVLSEEEQEDRKMVFFPICLGIKSSTVDERYKQKINVLLKEGLIEKKGEFYIITEKGLLWTGNISAYFIGEKRWNAYMNSFLFAKRQKLNPYNEDKMGVGKDWRRQ